MFERSPAKNIKKSGIDVRLNTDVERIELARWRETKNGARIVHFKKTDPPEEFAFRSFTAGRGGSSQTYAAYRLKHLE